MLDATKRIADIDKPWYEMRVGFYQLHFLSTRPC
ncbi:hypothetical protein T11_12909 [Trichinella zimbabwensis]|uniref:Uncharacterized protein n=1 Tax=Trichinella zimbabwensis TaxID=268475 RepID=A0A0V1G8M7_9BILA|nr:hypothetical protein T11_12909 [Trichinella zimbabwensis]